MSLFFIYNEEGLHSNYETVIRDYLNKKLYFYEQMFFYTHSER